MTKSTNTLSRQVGKILRVAKIDAEVKGSDYLGTVTIKAPKVLHSGIEALMLGNGLAVVILGNALHVQRF